MITRREALVGAAAASLAAPAIASAAPGDVVPLTSLMRLEQALQFAYAEAANDADAKVRAIARELGAHEGEHVAALATDLEAMGARRPRPPASIEDVEALLRPLGIERGDDGLEYLLAIEEAVISAYVLALGRLRDMRLLQTASSILGSQAQHAVVLRAALRRDPIPAAFEAGSTQRVP